MYEEHLVGEVRFGDLVIWRSEVQEGRREKRGIETDGWQEDVAVETFGGLRLDADMLSAFY